MDSISLYLNLTKPKINGNGHAKEQRRDAMRSRPPIQARQVNVRPSARPKDEDIQATFDLAADGRVNSAHWQDTDAWDADSGANRFVRQKMVRRSRLEADNNGYLSGMQKTHAAFVVRKGPRLVLLDEDEQEADENDEENKRIKRDWHRWCKKIKLRRKLHTMARAKVRDGECFAVVRNNPGVKHPVKLDVVLFETEQCQTPLLPQGLVGFIDGVRFDPWGNPHYYDVLPRHPGALGLWNWSIRPDHIPSRFILHWFYQERANQHRGLPEQRSTIGLGAVARRYREATTAGAEQQACRPTVFHTQLAPFSEENPDQRVADPLNPGETMEIPPDAGIFAPMGWDVANLAQTQPPANYTEFNKQTNSELARPIGQPFTLAGADASGVSFAGHKVETTPYYMLIDEVEREDCNDLVMDPLFALWWQEYVLFREATFDPIEGADPDEPPEHRWDWPRTPVADAQAEANTNAIKLRTLQATPSQVAHESGESFEAMLLQASKDYGVPVEKVRETLFQANFAPKSGGVLPGTGGSQNQRPSAGYGDQPSAEREQVAKLAAAMTVLANAVVAIQAQFDQRGAIR